MDRKFKMFCVCSNCIFLLRDWIKVLLSCGSKLSVYRYCVKPLWGSLSFWRNKSCLKPKFLSSIKYANKSGRSEYITETILTIRDTRRRTTVLKEIVEHFGFKDGDKIRWVLFRDNTIVVVPKLEKLRKSKLKRKHSKS